MCASFCPGQRRGACSNNYYSNNYYIHSESIINQFWDPNIVLGKRMFVEAVEIRKKIEHIKNDLWP